MSLPFRDHTPSFAGIAQSCEQLRAPEGPGGPRNRSGRQRGFLACFVEAPLPEKKASQLNVKVWVARVPREGFSGIFDGPLGVPSMVQCANSPVPYLAEQRIQVPGRPELLYRFREAPLGK